MSLQTVKQLCRPSEIVRSANLADQIAELSDLRDGRIDGTGSSGAITSPKAWSACSTTVSSDSPENPASVPIIFHKRWAVARRTR